ncbi:cupin domain-containing protein [Psychroflexus tropicus]|uniref:cupin domain-containing protein n=1 Tax=Psychroflexus tropicus TaxID=197345 RepID=UPI0003618E25|nr:cupin domain-containing protein [Psychroflexus tropicus]
MAIKTINLKEKLDCFSEAWSPKIIGELNNQQVKIAKFKGEFIHHQHEEEDELFLVIEGEIKIELKDKTLDLKAGEMVIIPKGTTHKPIGIGEAKVLMFEPKTTLNTGNKQHDFTKTDLDKL